MTSGAEHQYIWPQKIPIISIYVYLFFIIIYLLVYLSLHPSLIGCEVLWWVCLSVGLSVSLTACLSVCPTGYLQNPTCDLYQFLCMLPMSVARSSSGMFTIGRIAYRREAGDGRSAQRGRSVIYDRLVYLFVYCAQYRCKSWRTSEQLFQWRPVHHGFFATNPFFVELRQCISLL